MSPSGCARRWRAEPRSAKLALLIVDPTPGWRKHLEITYEQTGQKKFVSIDEGQNWNRDDGAAK